MSINIKWHNVKPETKFFTKEVQVASLSYKKVKLEFQRLAKGNMFFVTHKYVDMQEEEHLDIYYWYKGEPNNVDYAFGQAISLFED